MEPSGSSPATAPWAPKCRLGIKLSMMSSPAQTDRFFFEICFLNGLSSQLILTIFHDHVFLAPAQSIYTIVTSKLAGVPGGAPLSRLELIHHPGSLHHRRRPWAHQGILLLTSAINFSRSGEIQTKQTVITKKSESTTKFEFRHPATHRGFSQISCFSATTRTLQHLPSLPWLMIGRRNMLCKHTYERNRART